MEKENKIYMDSLVKSKEVYIAPVIETIEVKVEQGFEISPPSPSSSRDENEYTW